MADKTYIKFPDIVYSSDDIFGLSALLSRIYRVQYVALNNALRDKLGIGCIHYLPLINVWRVPGISQKDLAQLLSISKAMVSKSLKELELLGYIERRNNPNDRRNNMIYLTPEGEAMNDACVNIHRQINNEITSDLSSDEARIVSACLKRILVRALDKSIGRGQTDEIE